LSRYEQADIKWVKTVTGWFCVLPDFITIGAQKCGTRSLYHYLVQHPCIVLPQKKEVHFFDLNFDKGGLWYRAHFARIWSRWLARAGGRRLVTGESTPYYMFHPRVPERVFGTIPQVKLIALLRNPVDRAYSHYQSRVRKGLERLSFEEAIQKEAERLKEETERMSRDENYRSLIHQYHSYLSRSVYADQLKEWLSFFPRRQILALRSENFFADTSGTLEIIFRFLNLPAFEIRNLRPRNQSDYDTMEAGTRGQLLEYFAPHNQRLYRLLGEDFGWDR